MKVLVLLGLLALGCGAEGGSAGGDAGAEVCRAPTGCTAVFRNGGCGYSCVVGDAGNLLRACIPLADGGVVGQGAFASSVPPSAILADRPPYATDVRRDPANCTDCGRQCAAREVCGVAPGNSVVTCYLP